MTCVAVRRHAWSTDCDWGWWCLCLRKANLEPTHCVETARVLQGVWTALMRAAWLHHKATVAELLRLGADVTVTSHVRIRRSRMRGPRRRAFVGMTLWWLWSAALCCRMALLLSCSSRSTAIPPWSQSSSAGAQIPTRRPRQGVSRAALPCAELRRRSRWRVSRFAEQDGDTALMLSVSARRGKTATVTELVRRGANVNARGTVRSRKGMPYERYPTESAECVWRCCIWFACAAGWLDCAPACRVEQQARRGRRARSARSGHQREGRCASPLKLPTAAVRSVPPMFL
jgi:hypothetical protein